MKGLVKNREFMNMGKFFNIRKLIAATLLFAPALASAQESAVSTSALPFLDRTHGAVRSSMSGLGTVSDDAYLHWGNVSAAAFSSKTFHAGVGYSLWQPSVTKASVTDFGALWHISERWAVTAGVSVAAYPIEHRMDEYGVALSDFRPMDAVAGAGVAFRIIDCLSVGAAFNWAGSRGIDSCLDAFAADVNLTFRKYGVNVTAFAKNLGTAVKSSDRQNFALPMSAGLEAGYGLNFGKSSLYGAVQGQCWFGGPFGISPSAAAEYSWNNMIFCRAGLHYGAKKNGLPSYGSLGLCIHLYGFSLDLSWNAALGAMKNTFACGVGYSF